jgi:hypothetical protein
MYVNMDIENRSQDLFSPMFKIWTKMSHNKSLGKRDTGSASMSVSKGRLFVNY